MGKKDQIYIDKKSLNDIKRSLTKVFPTTGKQNAAIVRGMKKAAKPLVSGLKNEIGKEAKDTGKLKRSITTFRAKRLDKYKRPSIYIGPKVKPPTKFKDKKGATQKERTANAKARKAWAKKQSGYYFYFLEYGFVPFGKGELKGGLGLLPKTVAAKGGQAQSLLYNKIFEEIKKSAIKQGIKIK
tara:strand:+ start:3847 stop:4398 length:552 start_codon:yes stop_codon:yes gene_type:complete